MAAPARERELISAFVELADTMVGGYDVVDLLYRLVARCAETLGAAAAGILLPDEDGTLEVVASTSERSQLIGLLQLDARQGPCVDAYRTGAAVAVQSISEIEHRWPQFAHAAGELGYHWMHAIPLRLREEVIGSLNLFGDESETLTADDVRAAQGLADIATIGILHERAFRESDIARQQLQHALDSRVIIEQAKGVLAHTERVDMEEAFRLLRTRSRDRRVRLSDVAREVIDQTVRAAADPPGDRAPR